MLQQRLPFTVLKLKLQIYTDDLLPVATALTVYGIETVTGKVTATNFNLRCNSAYRLRY